MRKRVKVYVRIRKVQNPILKCYFDGLYYNIDYMKKTFIVTPSNLHFYGISRSPNSTGFLSLTILSFISMGPNQYRDPPYISVIEL